MVDLALALACLIALLALPMAVRSISQRAAPLNSQTGAIKEGEVPVSTSEKENSTRSGIGAKIEKPVAGVISVRDDASFSNVGDGTFLYASLFKEVPMLNLNVINHSTETENPKTANIVNLDHFRNNGKKIS